MSIFRMIRLIAWMAALIPEAVIGFIYELARHSFIVGRSAYTKLIKLVYGGHMKRSEYIELLTQAKIDSVEKRWKIIRDNSDECLDVIKCPLCTLNDRLRASCYTACPFVLCSMTPTTLFGRWYHTRCGSDEERAAAQAIIDFIENIDVEKWADTLVERGVIKP